MNKAKYKIELIEILNFCINNKTLEFTSEKFNVPPDYIENESVVFQESGKYSINYKSVITNRLLLKIAEEKLNKKLPIDFSKAILFVKEFENEIKKPETNVSWAGLFELTGGLSAYVLAKLHNENNLNLPEFLFQLIDNSTTREQHIHTMERYFSLALPYLNINVEYLLQILKRQINSTSSRHILIDFSKELAQIKPQLVMELFELIVKDNCVNELKVIPSSLLIGLYNNHDNTAFSKAINLFENYPDQTIYFLGRINFKNQVDLKRALDYCEKVDSSKYDLLNNCLDVYTNILKCPFVNEDAKHICFNKLQEAFEVDNPELKNTLLYYFSHWIENYEKERYLFLLKNFSAIENKEIIKHYFHNFKNPIYFFDFFQKIYQITDKKVNMDYFESGLSHFWRSNQEITENSILHFVSNEISEWREAGVKLLKSKHSGVFKIDVLKLPTEIEQLRCLEALSSFNIRFESFLPIILPFRNSCFTPVKKELQRILAFLVYESYHESLYKLIVSHLDTSKTDRTFLRPIKKALDAYHELVKKKDSVKDIDPIQNERNYMDLYYRLEHENNAIMMNSIKNEKSGLMSLFGKSQIIVRGHSWKLEGRNEVLPLGKIEHSFMVDSRAFKNTELFENNMKNPKSKY